MDFISLMAPMMGTGTGTGTGTGAQGGSGMIIMLAVMMVLIYVLMFLPQKKQQKKDAQMRSSLDIGDEVLTQGGIIGRVVTVKEDTLIIETGADRNKMKITKWAVSANNTANEKAEAERQAAREAAEAEKKAKMEEAADASKARRKKTKKKDDTFDS